MRKDDFGDLLMEARQLYEAGELKLALESISLITRTASTDEFPEVYLFQGEVYLETGEVLEAEKAVQKALEGFLVQGDEEGRFKCLTVMAQIEEENDRFLEAVGNFFLARSVAKNISRADLLATAQLNLGRLAMMIGEVSEALRYFKEGLGVVPKKEVSLRIHLLEGAGDANLEMAEFEKAEEAFVERLVLTQAQREPHHTVEAYLDLARLSDAEEKSDMQKGYIKHALTEAREGKDKQGEADALDSLGVYHMEREDLTEAIRLWEEALNLELSLEHVECTLGVRLQIGACHMEREEYFLAEKQFRELLTKEEIMEEDMKAQVWFLLGFSQVHGDNPQRGRKALTIAKKLFEKIGDFENVEATEDLLIQTPSEEEVELPLWVREMFKGSYRGGDKHKGQPG